MPSELVIATISLFLNSQRRDKSDKVTELIVKTLLDSGSLAGNFISASTLSLLGANQNYAVDTGLVMPICSGFDNSCTVIPNVTYTLSISLNENFVNNSLDSIPEVFTFQMVVKVLPKNPFRSGHR
jgi:hypothetical protein